MARCFVGFLIVGYLVVCCLFNFFGWMSDYQVGLLIILVGSLIFFVCSVVWLVYWLNCCYRLYSCLVDGLVGCLVGCLVSNFVFLKGVGGLVTFKIIVFIISNLKLA